MSRFFLTAICLWLLIGCHHVSHSENSVKSISEFALIPKVNQIEDASGSLQIRAKLDFNWKTNQNEDLKNRITQQWQQIITDQGTDDASTLLEIIIDTTLDLKSEESYHLEIHEHGITISALSDEGVYRAWQTLRQMLYLKGEHSIGCGLIIDFPKYSYRGAMLDVARHFFSVDEVKRYINQLAFYKINYFHMHLSDDQGWRIHIDRWPLLTEIGGISQVDGGEAGFYTQDEYQDIVQYAAERFITVVPEIDVPGHTNAALASYAELNCDNKKRDRYYGREVGFSTLCVDKEITYQFVEDVIREISQITPGPYFHIGGDETHATPEEDYIQFINRVIPLVGKYGKKVIGWDEINLGELPPDAVVQYWANTENAVNGVQKGAKVLMSPASYAYLDMKYDSLTPIGYHWAGYIDTQRAYSWTPETLVEGVEKENIIGIEAPLWGETITNSDDIEYLAFPRLLGYAEIGWSERGDSRTWDEYKKDLAIHGKLFEKLGIHFYRDPKVNWLTASD
ncbi:MAG: family 20 glycosylhydrolase [Flavobacteriaceae bacterium]|nr:family 20 glycosylhydrolase [Flavobacteriaceae bacterium]MCY4266487.1 family 20 glycosylhydrolase [Flavobacteriaceae bacterium]